MPEVELPVFGSMGKDVSIAGSGWDDDIGVLTIGPVKAGTAVQRQLLLFAQGADAKNIRYNVVHVVPEFLKVTLGETTVLARWEACQDAIDYRHPSAEYAGKLYGCGHRGSVGGKAGQIKIDTTSAEVHQLRIRVRFRD